MLCPCPLLILKRKREHVCRARLPQGSRQLLDDERLSIVGIKIPQFLSNCLRPVRTKKRVHVFPNSVVVETWVDAVIVEEEDTIASPVRQHGVDEGEREPFISPRVDKEERRYKLDPLESLNYRLSDFLILDLRLVLEFRDARKRVNRRLQ